MRKPGRRSLFAPLIIALFVSQIAVAGEPEAPAIPTGSGKPEASPAAMVVLLHGLARSYASMSKMAGALEAQGYHVCNIDYPSTKYPIEVLAEEYVLPAIQHCRQQANGSRSDSRGDSRSDSGSDRKETTLVAAGDLHFVTHSMGGIIARYLLARGLVPSDGRVVMLAPPNGGSEVVDKLAHAFILGPVFTWINGPAGHQLGTGTDSLPNTLGVAHAETGIVTGTRTIDVFSSMLIPGTDDGKVSIESAKLQGMRDFLVLPVTHTYIMRNARVIAQVTNFLRNGQFNPPMPRDE